MNCASPDKKAQPQPQPQQTTKNNSHIWIIIQQNIQQ